MTRIARGTIIVLLLIMKWFSTTTSSTISGPKNRRPSHLPFASPSRSHSTLSRRGVPGMPGDIEWMGFYGSLLAVPTMLSVLGIVTNYNLEKSYFNSQLNAQYYRQTREMLRAHTAKLIKEQEVKFAKQGTTWKGMVYDQDGKVRSGVKQPSWGGKALGVEDEVPPKKGGDGGGGVGAPASGEAGGEAGAGSQGTTGATTGAGQTEDTRSGANGGTSPGGTEAGGISTGDGSSGGTGVGAGTGSEAESEPGASQGLQDSGAGGQRSRDARGADATGAREGSGEDDTDNSRSGPDDDDQHSDSDGGDGGDAASA